MTITEKIINYLEENEELFNRLIEELDSYDGYLDDDRWYPMDELPELLNGTDIMQVINMVCYGDFSPEHEYFKINGYGNLESSDYLDYSDHLDKYFVEDLMENRNSINIDDEELEYMLDELEEE